MEQPGSAGGSGRRLLPVPPAPLRLTAMYDVRICGFSLLVLLPTFAALLMVIHLTGAIIALSDSYKIKTCYVDYVAKGTLQALLAFQFISLFALGLVVVGAYWRMRRTTQVAICCTAIIGLILLVLHGVVATAVGVTGGKIKSHGAKRNNQQRPLLVEMLRKHGRKNRKGKLKEHMCGDKDSKKYMQFLMTEVVFFIFDCLLYPIFIFLACETTKAYGFHPEYDIDDDESVEITQRTTRFVEE